MNRISEALAVVCPLRKGADEHISQYVIIMALQEACTFLALRTFSNDTFRTKTFTRITSKLLVYLFKIDSESCL